MTCQMPNGCLHYEPANACPLCDEHGADDIANYEHARDEYLAQPLPEPAPARDFRRRLNRLFGFYAVLGFACFADPSQQGIWVMPSQVVSVLHNAGDCAKGSNTKIVTLSGKLCVRETPQEVVKLLNEAGK